MNIFAYNIMPIRVYSGPDNTGTEYIARPLVVRAADAAYKQARREMIALVSERYHYSDEGQKFVLDNLSRDLLIEFDVLNDTPEVYSKLTSVLVSSDPPLTAEAVLDLFFNEPDFFDKCYEAAIQLNPKFAPVEEAPNTAETREAATIKN